MLTLRVLLVIIRTAIVYENTAEWCNGSTADSDSVCEGSNPSSAANYFYSC